MQDWTGHAAIRRFIAGPFAAAMMIGLTTVASQSAWAQAEGSKTAGEVFKNVTQLKDIPADQLMPSMQFIASALGVECTFCHVQGKMDADDKPAKKTARRMMAMTAEINTANFGGRQEVTCYSCHRGSEHPVNTPPVLESDAPPAAVHQSRANAPEAGAAPPVEQVIEKYVAAIGGADAIHKVTSRIEKGNILAGGSETPVEIVTKAPNKRVTITHFPGGDGYTAFDGTAGWMSNGGHPARDMSAAESGAFALDAEFYFALRLKELFPKLRVGRPDVIDGAECETLIGSGPGHPPVRLYFDRTSGLLVRMVRFAETPVGRNPTQIDYADYRDVQGVKIPFKWTLSRPNGRFTIQIADVSINPAVDDAQFAKRQ